MDLLVRQRTDARPTPRAPCLQEVQRERYHLLRCGRHRGHRRVACPIAEPRKIYADQPAALQLRAMNIIYETTKERGTTILISSSMVDSMNPAAAVAVALAAQAAAAHGAAQQPVH